ncbi:MFS transporter [Pseudorhodoferax sp.]|uniref:MFS transporter n=1 Tax=Pseudorhodoferax sp. TaxID=1993553 RepID=UPI002DD68277|nr:MFS transporter [Pseudorhodoferax sp.]
MHAPAATHRTGGASLLPALVLAMVLLQACMAGVRMAAPLLALQQGHSPARVGLLLALLSVAQLLLALPAGRWCDRHGLHRPMATAIVASALAAGAAALWPAFATLCLACLLTGASCGLASIALQRRIGLAAADAQARRQAFSWLSLGPALANALGPLVAGLAIDHAGWRTAFAALALLATASWLCVRCVPDAAPPRPAGADAPHAAPGRTWALLADPAMRRLLLVNWVLQACWDAHTLAVPLLAHERGFSASQTSLVLAAFAVAATAVRALLPWLARHLREWMVFTVAMGVTAAALGVFPLLTQAWAMAALSAVLGFVLGGVQPMAMSTLHQITPPGRHGEALGLRLVLLNATSTALPLAFGALGATAGISLLFWLMGGLAACGTRSALALRGVGASTAPQAGGPHGR